MRAHTSPAARPTPALHGGVPRHDGDRTLTSADVEAVACRVVELLRADRAVPAVRFVDAAELAGLLGVSRDTVYQHAAELGARSVGDGPRPRLRFDVAEALEAWTARSAGSRSQVADLGSAPSNRGGRPRRAGGASGDLLPIRGRRAA